MADLCFITLWRNIKLGYYNFTFIYSITAKTNIKEPPNRQKLPMADDEIRHWGASQNTDCIFD